MGQRRIEWVGQQSLFADPRVQYARATGRYSDKQLRLLRHAARKRVYRVEQRTVRRLLAGMAGGLSRSYQWGPDPASYIQPVEEADARLILACLSGNEFRDVTEGVPVALVMPQTDLTIIKREEFRSFRALERAMRGDGP